jgi:ABC-type oligopeptide transport system substrate-binding subunit
LSPTSNGYIQGIADIKSLQANLNQTNTALAKAQSQYDSAMDAARQSLYALDYTNEPTLGDWMPGGQQNGAWINKVNPAHPFGDPHFDRVAYLLFSDQASALAALENNEVELILDPDGLSKDVASQKIIPPLQLAYNITSSVNFIVINQANTALADSTFRQALSCLIDNGTLGRYFIALPQDTFVPDGNQPWINSAATNQCKGQAGSDRKKQATEILKLARYTWQKEPTDEHAGQGLTRPDGTLFPKITLVSADRGESSSSVSKIVEQMIARDFGIPLIGKSETAQDVRYEVFSSGDYDMAVLDWHLSAYPGYLCDWFKDGNPFGYQSSRLQSACDALNSTSELTTAQKDFYEIQSILAQDLPFIPLYSGITYDAYRNIKYPFDHVLGGLSGVYGAPSLAIPAP